MQQMFLSLVMWAGAMYCATTEFTSVYSQNNYYIHKIALYLQFVNIKTEIIAISCRRSVYYELGHVTHPWYPCLTVVWRDRPLWVQVKKDLDLDTPDDLRGRGKRLRTVYCSRQMMVVRYQLISSVVSERHRFSTSDHVRDLTFLIRCSPCDSRNISCHPAKSWCMYELVPRCVGCGEVPEMASLRDYVGHVCSSMLTVITDIISVRSSASAELVFCQHHLFICHCCGLDWTTTTFEWKKILPLGRVILWLISVILSKLTIYLSGSLSLYLCVDKKCVTNYRRALPFRSERIAVIPLSWKYHEVLKPLVFNSTSFSSYLSLYLQRFIR